MTALLDLKASAHRIAAENGHSPDAWKTLPDWPSAAVTYCIHCHASLAVDTQPLSPGAGFRGSALDLPCTRSTP